MSDSANQEVRFEGVGVSPGMACGKIHVVRDDLDDVVALPHRALSGPRRNRAV